MIFIESHIIKELSEPSRFIDYAIGLFPQTATRSAVKKSIKRGELLLNDKDAESGIWLKVTDKIDLVDPQHKVPREFPLEVEVVYEDDYMLVAHKPSGLVVSGNQFRTLENSLVNSITLSTQEDAFKWAKPVHRIDSATSGLVVFGKSAEAHRCLAMQFEKKRIQKTYRAIVQGVPVDQRISHPIDGKDSVSDLKVIETVKSLQNDFLTLVELSPKTGRTHQLRIHCKQLGCPIVGDKIHGEEGNVMNHKGLFLAALRLEFKHPITDEAMSISIDEPVKFNALMRREERRWVKFKGE